VTSTDVIRITCREFNITRDTLMGHSKVRVIVFPRMVAMYLCRELLNLSYPDIGRVFHRDHTTVMSARNNVIRSMRDNDDAKGHVGRIVTALNSNALDSSPVHCHGCERRDHALTNLRLVLQSALQMTGRAA
jgi:DnaA-like protein